MILECGDPAPLSVGAKRPSCIPTARTIAVLAAILLVQTAVSQEDRLLIHRDRTSPTGVYIPTDIEDAHRELDRILPASILRSMRLAKTEDVTVPMHMSLGLWIRNAWGLWRGSRLEISMAKLGFQHPDDMSAAILETYWRRLHGLPQRLAERAAASKHYWRQVAVPDKAKCPQDGSAVHWDQEAGDPATVLWHYGHCTAKHHWLGYRADAGWRLIGPKEGKPQACSPPSSIRSGSSRKAAKGFRRR